MAAAVPAAPGAGSGALGERINEAEFQLLDRIEEIHWWFVGKRLLLRALLAERTGKAGASDAAR